MKIDDNFIFPVYIYEKVLNTIMKLCKRTTQEIFGYLIGNILKWKETIYVIIEDQIFIIGAIHGNTYSTSQIEGTAGKYEKKFQKVKRMKGNENLRIIGWWHSHPGFGCFLSSTDLHTQQFFFPENYQVALVVDPMIDEYEFFTLEKNSKEGYKLISNAVISSE